MFRLERLNTVESFDSETKKWKKVCSISKPRSALGSAVLNNKLYVYFKTILMKNYLNYLNIYNKYFIYRFVADMMVLVHRIR
jgi:hypothetical protein